MSFDVARITDVSGNAYDDEPEEPINHPVTIVSRVQIEENPHCTAGPATPSTDGRGLQYISGNELAFDPFVLQLLEKIATLEERQTSAALRIPTVSAEDISVAVAERVVEPA